MLEDKFFEFEIPFGEAAHIVGRLKSVNSPRGLNSLPVSKRNNADNLMLLCPEHHLIIDKSKFIGDFTVERLRKLKQDQESLILHLTSLNPDNETTILRVLGGIRGASITLSRQQAREAVLRQSGRYAHFSLTSDRQGIEIDLSKFPEEGGDNIQHWSFGMAMIDKHMSLLNDAIHEGDLRHLSVFALTRIPLLIYLGYQLGDKVPVEIYQKQRGGDESWCWPNDEKPVAFHSQEARTGTDGEEVILIISLSGTIPITDLPSTINDIIPVFTIQPVGVAPNRDIFRNYESLDAFTRCYHDFLSALEQSYKRTRRIHLFASIPLAAAIVCGRGVMREVHPAIDVYDRTSLGFRKALTVNEL